jgi:amidase
MLSLEEYRQYDGLGLAELVKNGDVTPAELVESAIAQCEAVNPQLNAVVTPMFAESRQAVADGVPDGAFSGVPFLLKDLGTMYKGVRLTSGTRALANFVPEVDSEIVNRYKKTGLITIGKTNTPEFGLLPTTESHFLGACHNPWDLTRSTGGSSGGAAAAVIAGIVPAAHASDGGGSIRIPAACCGLVGVKPTRARTPRGPANGDVMSGISIENCVSRTVRDSAALLDAIAGADLGDPYVAPPQVRPYLAEVDIAPRPLRIGFATSTSNGVPIHPDCVTAVEKTAQLCADLGHMVEEASPVLDAEAFTKMFTTVWAAGCNWSVKGIALLSGQPAVPAMYEPLTWAMYEMGNQIGAGDYLLAVQGLQRFSRVVAGFFTKYDVWLTPTVAEPSPKLGSFEKDGEPLFGLNRAIDYVPFTPIANVTGQPAMSLPLHWNEAGLPIGVHFQGRFGDEATLFQLAGQLERACPWAGRLPVF